MAVAPDDPLRIAITMNTEDNFALSVDGGKTWRKVSGDVNVAGGKAPYSFNQIKIDPFNDQVVVVHAQVAGGLRQGRCARVAADRVNDDGGMAVLGDVRQIVFGQRGGAVLGELVQVVGVFHKVQEGSMFIRQGLGRNFFRICE